MTTAPTAAIYKFSLANSEILALHAIPGGGDVANLDVKQTSSYPNFTFYIGYTCYLHNWNQGNH